MWKSDNSRILGIGALDIPHKEINFKQWILGNVRIGRYMMTSEYEGHDLRTFEGEVIFPVCVSFTMIPEDSMSSNGVKWG